eukprot:s1031_g17.t1
MKLYIMEPKEMHNKFMPTMDKEFFKLMMMEDPRMQVEPLQEGQIMVGEVIPAQIEVDGHVLTAASSLATLRVACAQTLVKAASDQEKELHALTRTPYAAWCPSCLKRRARPDQHRRIGASHDIPVPVASMDVAVTKKMDGLNPNQERAAEDKGTLWLALTDGDTGYLGCIPIWSKGQLHYMTHEVLSFVQGLGYSEVGIYGDNEPTSRQILKTIITSRHALGVKTRIYTTKVKDSAGKKSIQRIRQLACTLVEDVCERIGLQFPCEHAIWRWAGRHAAWCLNRYQVGKSLTAYEVTHGKKCSGKTACFAEHLCLLQRTWGS